MTGKNNPAYNPALDHDKDGTNGGDAGATQANPALVAGARDDAASQNLAALAGLSPEEQAARVAVLTAVGQAAGARTELGLGAREANTGVASKLVAKRNKDLDAPAAPTRHWLA